MSTLSSNEEHGPDETKLLTRFGPIGGHLLFSLSTLSLDIIGIIARYIRGGAVLVGRQPEVLFSLVEREQHSLIQSRSVLGPHHTVSAHPRNGTIWFASSRSEIIRVYCQETKTLLKQIELGQKRSYLGGGHFGMEAIVCVALAFPVPSYWKKHNDDEVFVVTSGSEVRVLNLSGKCLRTFDGRGQTWRYSHDPRRRTAPTMAGGIAVHNGIVYLTDFLSDRLLAFSPHGEFLRVFCHRDLLHQHAPCPSFGPSVADFGKPGSMAVDADGLVYVAEEVLHRVQVFDPYAGNMIRIIGHSSQLASVKGIALDRTEQQNLFVCDWMSRKIAMFKRDGTFLTSFPLDIDDTPFAAHPMTVSVDQDNVIYVADDRGSVQAFAF